MKMTKTMKKTMMKGSLALAALTAIAVLAWALAAQAQVIDAGPCEKECNRDHAACVDTCGDGDNPEECDSECNEDWQDCLRECR